MGTGLVRVIKEGIFREGAFELRAHGEDMATWRSEVEGSWQMKEHVQRP